MILIKDIKIIETHNRDHFHRIDHYGSMPTIGVYDDGSEFYEVTTEMVEGKRFYNTYGLDVVIGWDKATQEALGLPFQVFEAQERRRVSDYEENTRLRKKVRELEGITFWQFLMKKIKR